jgi:hypothetical protein
MSDYDPTHDPAATRADESPQSLPKPVDPENTPPDELTGQHIVSAPPVPPEPGGRPPGVDELIAEGVNNPVEEPPVEPVDPPVRDADTRRRRRVDDE